VSDDPFLSRWSRLKKASASVAPGNSGEEPRAQARPAVAPPVPPPGPAPAERDGEPPALPPLESLTPESDFSPFMGAKVEEAVRRRALKTLFQDPRFNIMDGLDVYIDDYSVADPLPDGWLEKMSQLAHLGDQPPRAEDERRAAAEGESAPPDPTPEVKNTVTNETDAAIPRPESSDTEKSVDNAPPVGESHRAQDGLT
jgi:hypothetical protein